MASQQIITLEQAVAMEAATANDQDKRGGWIRPLPDGVYINLPAHRYFGQRRIGSTDLVKLMNRPADWWYGMPSLNPAYEEGDPNRQYERDFGHALHTLVLEGERAFRREIARPEEHGFKDFRARTASDWRDQQRALGRVVLWDKDVQRVRHMAALIKNHPLFKAALEGNGLSEVSVLFTYEGVPMRARFDRLLPRFILDLKSFGGHTRGRDLKDRCMMLIKDRHMDVQRFIYNVAREEMRRLAREGKIFGTREGMSTDKINQAKAFIREVAEVDQWRWVWLFYQRRDDRKGHAPLLQPVSRPPDKDLTLATGERKVNVAIANYKGYVARFGLDRPWADLQSAWEPDNDEFPVGLGDTAASDFDDTPQEAA